MSDLASLLSRRPRRWVLALLLPVCWPVLLPAQMAPDLEQLFLDLKVRRDVFSEGGLEVRVTEWTVDPQKLVPVAEATRLMSQTPVGYSRALGIAGKFERTLIDELGDGVQMAYSMVANAYGMKLFEVPLEPGDIPYRPRPSTRLGLRMFGYQDGITARYDQLKKELVLAPGESDSVFKFHIAQLDPTLGTFPLLNEIKMGDRNIAMGGMEDGLVSVIDRNDEEVQYFFNLAAGTHLLAQIKRLNKEKKVTGREFYGNYGESEDGGGSLPFSALVAEATPDLRVAIRLITVLEWKRRVVQPRELEIKVPKGTTVVREGF